MSRKLLLMYYRVEYEDYGRIRFVNGDDWRIQVDNYRKAEKIYHEVSEEFSKMVEDLSDGIWIDISLLEVLGKRLWFSRQYLSDFRAIVI